MKFLKHLILAASAIALVSCNSDDNSDSPQSQAGTYSNGAWVLVEGGFMHNNASISFINSNGEIDDRVFEKVNGRSLGDVAMSLNFEDDLAFIVVNNSNTIEVVNRYTMESVATIAGALQNPRYIEFHNNKAYVSNWGDGYDPNDDFIAVIDLNTYAVIQKIPVAEGPERLVEHDGKLYIAHHGGYGYGNTISILNLNSNTISGSITVSDVPNGLEEENGFLYVLCSGKEAWTQDETQGGLYKINLANNQIVDEFTLPLGMHPSHLQIENNKVYYVAGTNVYRTETANIEPTASAFIETASDNIQSIYGFNVVNGWIYIADAKDYASNGALYVYKLDGNLQSTYPIDGIAPNSVYFND